MAPYIKAISPNSRCRKILVLHNVAYVQYRRMMLVERNWRAKLSFFMNWLFLKRATLRHARRFDKCVVVSELDRDILKQDGPDLDITVAPGCVDTKSYPLLTDQPTTPTLLFVGKMSYSPNVDGAIFFCQEIFPLIKQRVPDAKLLIVGREPVSAVRALASDDVTVTGYVESIIPYYQQARVSVVPLRAGGGTRLKIPESMALGRPVVSTTLGCEGLAVTHGENILIADAPADFAAQTVRLLNDEELRRRLIANGRQLVETTYDWQVIAQQLLQVYDKTVSKQ
jgi:glycosyltransferase involved in cell wall biosynthesis